jgi:DNA uptake protein ComE-like DNA-binding protein
VVDVNHAREAVLMRLPGVTRGLARRIIELRSSRDDLASVDELGRALDLPDETVEGLRGRVVFVPRSG